MNNFGGWLRQLGAKMSASMRRFMMGRYGHDKLNITLLCIGLALSVVGMFVRNVTTDVMLTIAAYALLILCLWRCMSRNTYKRYQENRRFLLMIDRVKDRNNRYYSCPKCRQTVRVPRGKGKIAITCPKCRERFVKKT